MEPVHPPDTLDHSLLAVTVALIIILCVQWLLGHWDQFVAVAVAWFPFWHWGG